MLPGLLSRRSPEPLEPPDRRGPSRMGPDGALIRFGPSRITEAQSLGLVAIQILQKTMANFKRIVLRRWCFEDDAFQFQALVPIIEVVGDEGHGDTPLWSTAVLLLL
jgi:hypothetical protein